MSLDRLGEHLRTARAERRTLDLATITVQRAESSAWPARFTRVVVDGEQVGYLVGNEPRTFEVEPGEHTITVFFETFLSNRLSVVR